MKGISKDSVGDFRDASDEVIQGFLRILESVRVQEMPCNEVFGRLDEYVEKEILNHRAADLMPLLREHFDLCHNCCEEYEALLRVLEQSMPDEQAGASTPYQKP